MSYLRNQGLLDHPMVQLGRFVKNLFQGDLGRSLTVYPKVPIATLLKEKIPVTVIMVNGFQMRGEIRGFDNFVVLVDADGKQQMIYKHAISTITPSRHVDCHPEERKI